MSNLHQFLIDIWDVFESKLNVLKYSTADVTMKSILNSEYSQIRVILNKHRFTNRRPPIQFESTQIEFDSRDEAFNFTKVPKSEIGLKVTFGDQQSTDSSDFILNIKLDNTDQTDSVDSHNDSNKPNHTHLTDSVFISTDRPTEDFIHKSDSIESQKLYEALTRNTPTVELKHLPADSNLNEIWFLPNVSPSTRFHYLIVPDPTKYCPQVLNRDSLLAAILAAINLDSNRFLVGFNSLGAFASVNHLHFHLLLDIDTRNNLLDDSSSKVHFAYSAFNISTIGDQQLDKVLELVEKLYRKNVPFNLTVQKKSAENLVIYIFPKKLNYTYSLELPRFPGKISFYPTGFDHMGVVVVSEPDIFDLITGPDVLYLLNLSSANLAEINL